MSRLIDADGLKRQALFGITNDGIGMHVVTIEQIDEQPTIEAEPVRHGHWIEKKGFDGDTYYDCSACGHSWVTIEGTPQDNEMDYCPACGAKMDEVTT